MGTEPDDVATLTDLSAERLHSMGQVDDKSTNFQTAIHLQSTGKWEIGVTSLHAHGPARHRCGQGCTHSERQEQLVAQVVS